MQYTLVLGWEQTIPGIQIDLLLSCLKLVSFPLALNYNLEKKGVGTLFVNDGKFISPVQC